MDDIRKRLDQDLQTTMSRLRPLGGAGAIEGWSGALGDRSSCADEVDEIQIDANREIGWATREMLLARVNRLSAALDRLNDGEYGVCLECAERISPERLRAAPEVPMCVRCQNGSERQRLRLDRNRSNVFGGSTGGVMSADSRSSIRAAYFPNEEDRLASR